MRSDTAENLIRKGYERVNDDAIRPEDDGVNPLEHVEAWTKNLLLDGVLDRVLVSLDVEDYDVCGYDVYFKFEVLGA